MRQVLWTAQEDDMLRRLVFAHGDNEVIWHNVAAAFGGSRR